MNPRVKFLLPSLLLLAVSAVASAQCAGTAPTDAIAVWPFESDATDVPGPHDGMVLGTPVFGPAVIGNGITFNSDDDRVTVPHMADLNPAAPGFTVIFYMKGIHNQPQSQWTVVEKSHGFVDSTGWMMQGNPGTGGGPLAFAVGGGGGGSFNFPSVASNIDVLDGAFHLVAGTWTSATGLIELWVDGISQGTAAAPTAASNTRPVNVGYTWGGGSPQRFFRGTVDHLQIYSRALSQAEILAFVGVVNQYLSISQHPVTHVLTVCVAGASGSAHLVYSLNPLNGTSPGTGIWGGLHVDFTDLVNQLNLGLGGNPVWAGLIVGNQYSFTLPAGTVASLAGIGVWGVAYVNGPVAGFSNIDPHVFL